MPRPEIRQPQIRAQAKRALAAEQRRVQEDADRSARRSGQSSVDRKPIAIKRPKREGEWGVFSYAPDRPPGARKTQGRTAGGRPAASGFGSTEKVQERLGSSELVERMRKERARATEASRARAAAAAAASGGGIGCGGEHEGTSQENGTGYRVNEPNGTAYKARGLQRGDVGDGVRGGRDVVQHHRPSPPVQQRDGVAVGGGRGGRGAGGGGGGGRGGRLGAAERYQGGRNGEPPGSNTGRPANAGGAGEDVHAMYEERLTKLERRLAGAGERSHRQGQQQQQTKKNTKVSSRPPPSSGSGGEWGAENNPFGYHRKLSAGEDGGGYGSAPSSSGKRALSRRGSEVSGGEDVEGLSTMYMGPIAHKMAELRAGNG